MKEKTVVVIAKTEALPPKAGMYAGQTGTVIKEEIVGGEVYSVVEFQNGDTAAYLNHEIAAPTQPPSLEAQDAELETSSTTR